MSRTLYWIRTLCETCLNYKTDVNVEIDDGVSIHKKVLPAIGLVHLPFFAARISANRAGLMPFFLHLFNSASLKPLVSKPLALHSLLDLDALSMAMRGDSGDRRCVKEWVEVEVVDTGFAAIDVRSMETLRSITRRVGDPDCSVRRGIIFRKSEWVGLWSRVV